MTISEAVTQFREEAKRVGLDIFEMDDEDIIVKAVGRMTADIGQLLEEQEQDREWEESGDREAFFTETLGDGHLESAYEARTELDDGIE